MTKGEAKHKAECEKWARAMQEQKQSGESITQWCERAGISRTTFYHWQSKYRLASLRQREEDREGRVLIRVNPKELPIAHVENGQPKESFALVMRIGEVRLEIPDGVSIEKIAALAKALAGVC